MFHSMPGQSGESIQLIGLGAGPGARLRILPSLAATAWARGGYAFGTFAGEGGGSPYARAGAELGLYLTPSFRLGLGAEYRQYFAASEPLYQGLGLKLAAGFNFSQANRRSKVEIRDIILLPIFPVFYKYYDANSLGSVRIRNGEEGPIRDVRVSFFVKQYMDAPKECAAIAELRKGEERELPLYALFSRSILSILEPTKAQAEIRVSYRYAERPAEAGAAAALSLNHRNAMSWDDDRKIASFATMNDPSVMRFAKQIAGLARASGWQSLDVSLRQAAGLFEGLGLYGLRYVVDPNTPHAELAKDGSAVDYLQFPLQTLEFRAGDCDDLSILMSALLEASGVETAYLTAPGHIYLAFALEMPPAQARGFFSRPEDLIMRGDKAWVPLEITALEEGFLRAWQLGAREWREAQAASAAGFWPTHEAWKLYEPVALAAGESLFEPPRSSELLARYQGAMAAFVERETGPRAERLQAEAAASRKDPRPLNKLGVLYARYCVYDKAEASFRASLKAAETEPAWLNLGGVLSLKADYKGALAAYKSAYRLVQGSPKALEGLVRSAYELDDRDAASRWLEELARVDRGAAERHAYARPGGQAVGARAGPAAGIRASASAGAASLQWEE